MKKNKALIFILGALCFLVSQPLLRLPLLNYLQKTMEFTVISILHPLIVGILIAFSAGVFEEGFRFIFKRFILRPEKTSISEPIIFGLGHGLSEAPIVLGPAMISYPIKMLTMGIIERILVTILHIGLTVIVWNGFQLNKRIRYLLIAIFIHGLVNSLIPIVSMSVGMTKVGILIIEGALALIDIFIIIYVYRSRKNYLLKEEKWWKILKLKEAWYYVL